MFHQHRGGKRSECAFEYFSTVEGDREARGPFSFWAGVTDNRRPLPPPTPLRRARVVFVALIKHRCPARRCDSEVPGLSGEGVLGEPSKVQFRITLSGEAMRPPHLGGSKNRQQRPLPAPPGPATRNICLSLYLA